MAKQKDYSLGVFIIKHPTGMLETDKGEKSFQGNIGDTFRRGVDGKTYIVPKSGRVSQEEIVEIAEPEVLTGEGE